MPSFIRRRRRRRHDPQLKGIAVGAFADRIIDSVSGIFSLVLLVLFIPIFAQVLSSIAGLKTTLALSGKLNPPCDKTATAWGKPLTLALIEKALSPYVQAGIHHVLEIKSYDLASRLVNVAPFFPNVISDAFGSELETTACRNGFEISWAALIST